MGRRGRAGNKGGAFSCFACREKKVFCDKVQPCGRCTLLGLECIMQTRGRGRPARPKQESGSEDGGLGSGGLQSMGALGMEGAGPAPAEGLALEGLSEPAAMMDAEEEGGIIGPPVVLMDMGCCDPSLSKPRCDGSSSSSGEPGTSPPSPLSSSSSSSSRSSSQSRPTSPSTSPLVHCSTITEEAVMDEGCGTEERQLAWQGGREAEAGMRREEEAEEDAKRLVVAPATLTSTWQSAGPAGLSFKVDLPVGGLDELRLSYVVCCRRVSELRNCGRFAMQKGDFVWRTIEFLFLSEGDVYSGWELLEVLCGSYAKPAIEQQEDDMGRQVARAVMPGCSGGSSVSTGAAELAMLKGGGGRPAFGHWRLADGAGGGDGGDAWIAELMDTPSAACVHFCLARPDVLVEEQVRCNATMSSLFMSVDEICRASLQLHCVFPHVLAKVVRRESHQDFFGAMMDVSFVSEHIAHQDCIVQVCDRRGRIFSCLSTLRCRFSPMAVDLVIRFLPLPPSQASAATSSRPTRVAWPQVSTPAPPYAVAATDNPPHLLQQQQAALNTRGIRTWHTAPPPAAVLIERPPTTAPPPPPPGGAANVDGSTSYVFTWGTNHHTRPQPPVPPPATSRPWPPAATYPSWQQPQQQAPAPRLGGPLPMAPPPTLKPPIADTAAARALAAAALAAPPTSPFDAMSRSFMDLAS